MAGLGSFAWVSSCSASSECYSASSLPARSRNSRVWDSLLLYGSCQEKQKQLPEVVVSILPASKMHKTDPGRRDFWQRLISKPLGFNTATARAQSRPSTSDVQIKTRLDGGQVFTGLGLSRPGHDHELQSLCEEGQLDRALDVIILMDQQGMVPSLNLYRALLKGFTKRKLSVQAKRLHAHLIKQGLEISRMLGEYVVNMLVKCGDLEGALQTFHKLPSRTAFSWTAVISGYTLGGKGRKALGMYKCMQEQGVEPNKYTIIALLRACGSIPDGEEGKRIHAEAVKYRHESDLFVGTCLVDMYAKCGRIANARNVFDGLSQHDVVSWNALLSAYAQEGQPEKALQLYEQMQEEGASPDDRTYVALLQACGVVAEEEEAARMNRLSIKMKALNKGKAMHAHAKMKGYTSDIFVRSALVSMYGRCGSTVDAQNVFDDLVEPDIVSWNAMLAAYAQQGQGEMAWQLYEQLREEGESPNDRTFVSGLQACGMLAEMEQDVMVGGRLTKAKSLTMGKVIHADTCKKGYDSDVFVGSILISMYGKCGSILDAQSAFDELSERNVVSWNGMLTAYAQQGQAKEAWRLYEQMQREGVSPSDRTCVTALQACGMLAEGEEDVMVDGQLIKSQALQFGKLIHAAAEIKGYNSDPFVGNALLCMYGKCRSIVDAQNAFDGLSRHTVVSWNSILAAYTQQGQAQKALELYEEMQQKGVSPNERTFVSVLQACGILAEKREDVLDGHSTNEKYLDIGKAVHADAQKQGCASDVFVANTLITMYGKWGKIVDAQNVFEGLPKRDVVSWNAMISVYVQQFQGERALQLYDRMWEEGLIPNGCTFVSALQACGMVAENGCALDDIHTKVHLLEKVKTIQFDAWRDGYKKNTQIGTILIRMYGKCGNVIEAEKVFDELPQRSAVAWTEMLKIYAQHSQKQKAWQVYRQMQAEGVSPDDPTLLSALQECGMLAEKEEGPLDKRSNDIFVVAEEQVHQAA